jgi:hypothetical protein
VGTVADDDELLESGRPPSQRVEAVLAAWDRLPHRRWLVSAGALVLAALVVVTVGHDTRPKHRAGAITAAPAAPASAESTPTESTPASIEPTPPTAASRALDRLVVRAESTRPVPISAATEATSTCPVVPTAVAATHAVRSALTKRLPEFTLIDASGRRNPNGTLCELDVRARDILGAMVVVSVVAPPHARGPSHDVAQSNDRTTVRDIAVYSGGWRVEVGWVAQAGAGINSAGLKAVANDRALRW